MTDVAARGGGWLADRTIRTKILLALTAMALTAVITGAFALSRMAVMDDKVSRLHAVNVQELVLLGDIRGAQSLINHNATVQGNANGDPQVIQAAQQGTELQRLVARFKHR